MKYEGHFVLWYLILMPFAKLGAPYITTNIISWIITSISVLLILKKAPFRFYKKVLLIASFPLIYLFPVISRCYCLIPFAITLLCIFYKDRKEKPLKYLLAIIMLANTHVIMLGMVGIVLFEYLLELVRDFKISGNNLKQRIIGFIVAIVLLVLSLLPLLGSLITNQEVGNSDNILLKIIYSMFYCPIVFISQIYFITMTDEMAVFIILLIIVWGFFEIKNSPLDYLKMWPCVLWQCVIHTFIYNSSQQRTFSIVFILMYFKWTGSYKEPTKLKDIEKRIVDVCWGILVGVNIIEGALYVSSYEICKDYSKAYEIGNYINENIEDNSIILTGSKMEFASSIIPYVNNNIKFYHIPGERYFSYAIWDNKNKLRLNTGDIEKISKHFKKEEKLYYIYCNGKSNVNGYIAQIDEINIISDYVENGIFNEIYSTETDSLYFENYTLYEINLIN